MSMNWKDLSRPYASTMPAGPLSLVGVRSLDSRFGLWRSNRRQVSSIGANRMKMSPERRDGDWRPAKEFRRTAAIGDPRA
jgi:hypothetical protein